MNTNKRFCVAGYRGEIGSFILNGLLRTLPKALDIFCFDINETKEEVEARIKVSDVIFLCVPIKKTIVWLEEHKESLKNKLIIEQASSKEWIYNHPITKELRIESMHILFRPSQTPNLDDRRVALFMGQGVFLLSEQISAITQSKIVVFNSIKEHDTEMALQQALLHRLILITGKMLDDCRGQTYISKKILELRDRIRKGDKDLYTDIQKNPHLRKQLNCFDKNMKEFDIDNIW